MTGSSPGFASLNVAAAVQILAYELFLAAGAAGPSPDGGRDDPADPPAPASALAGFYRHLERALVAIGYLDPRAPKLLMRRLRRLFNRAQPLESEIAILRGILTAAERGAGERAGDDG